MPLVDGKSSAHCNVVTGLIWTLSTFPLEQPAIPSAWAGAGDAGPHCSRPTADSGISPGGACAPEQQKRLLPPSARRTRCAPTRPYRGALSPPGALTCRLLPPLRHSARRQGHGPALAPTAVLSRDFRGCYWLVNPLISIHPGLGTPRTSGCQVADMKVIKHKLEHCFCTYGFQLPDPREGVGAGAAWPPLSSPWHQSTHRVRG